MILARVIGNVWSTRKEESLRGLKFLIVQPIVVRHDDAGRVILEDSGHTVVAGDTLSGIASKYKVSAASIKQANNMTRDIVVLGKKMVIPPAR